MSIDKDITKLSTKEFEKLKISASTDPNVAFAIGEYYAHQGNEYKMLKYYKMAATTKHVEAMYKMALYFDKKAVNEPLEYAYKKLKYLKMAAELDHIQSINALIAYYESKCDMYEVQKYKKRFLSC